MAHTRESIITDLSVGTITLDRLPPAVVQKTAHPARSERYVHINTRDIIGVLEKEGFAVNSVQVTKTRAKTRDPLYARHQVVLRNPTLAPIDGVVPQFLFTNSHDGSSSAQALLGAFRFVCSNGLIVGTTLGKARVRHTGDAAADIIERMQALARSTTPLFDKIAAWSRIELTPARTRKFAQLASVLRWGDPHRFDMQEVLKARREEDAGDTLWKVFNRVQENAARGGLVGMSVSGRQATSRPLSDIVASTTFNTQLWQLAEEFSVLR